MTKVRAFTFTKNNYTDEDVVAIRELAKTARYCIFGREVGDEGTPHLQGYIYFANKRANSFVVTLGLGHVEQAKGNPQQNYDYCSKSKDFEEFGELPIKGKRNDLESVRDAIRERKRTFDEMAENHIRVLARYPNFIEKLQAHYHPPVDLPGLDNLWIYGPPGTGKTTHAKSLGSYYIKMPNKWFDGYDDQDVVIVEDIGPKQGEMLHHFLKIWADHSPFQAQVKGSSKLIRPKRIIVTSNYSIDEMGFDAVTTKAIKRRFKAKHFGKI